MKRGPVRSSPKRYKRPHHAEFGGEDDLSYGGVSVPPDARPVGRRLGANNHRRIEPRDFGHSIEDLHDVSGLVPPSGGRQAQAQLKITNLSPDVEHRRLRDAVFHRFKHYGRIMVVLEGRGTQRECYVDFDFEGDALTAKHTEQGKSLFDYSMQITFMKLTSGGRVPIDAGEHRDDDGRVATVEQPPTRTLFVGNLELDVGDRELRRVFSEYGKVESVDVKRASQGSQATYAFVRFANVEAAMRAKERMQGYQLGRNHMRIGYGRGTPTTLLWVGGLGWVSKAELEHEFDRFGAIRRIDYRSDENYAYIQYDSIDAAIAACNEMRGSRLGGHKLQVDFADAPLTPSQPRERKVTYTPPLVSSRATQGYKSNRRYEQQRGSLDHREELRGSGRQQQLEYEDINDFELPPYEPVRDSRNSYGDDLLYTGRYKSEPVGPRRQSAVDYPQQQDVSRVSSRGRRPDTRQPHAKRPRLDMNEMRSVARPSHQQRIQNAKAKRRPSSVSPAIRRLSAPVYQRTRHLSVHEQQRRKSKETSKARPVNRFRAHSDSRAYSRPKSRIKGPSQLRSQSAKEPKQEKQEKKNKKDSKPVERKPVTTMATTLTSTKTAESLGDLAKRFAVAWKGQLQLKTAAFSVRMHLIAGDPSLADQLLRGAQGQTIANTSFSVTQRLRLEQTKLEEVNRKVNTAGPSGHCMLLAQPGPAPTVKDQKQDAETDESDSQTMKHLPLRNFIAYLRGREAAGIVMLSAPQSTSGVAAAGKDMSGIMYIFPPCIFSQQHLTRIAPSLPSEPSKEDHLLVIVVRNVN